MRKMAPFFRISLFVSLVLLFASGMLKAQSLNDELLGLQADVSATVRNMNAVEDKLLGLRQSISDSHDYLLLLSEQSAKGDAQDAILRLRQRHERLAARMSRSADNDSLELMEALALDIERLERSHVRINALVQSIQQEKILSCASNTNLAKGELVKEKILDETGLKDCVLSKDSSHAKSNPALEEIEKLNTTLIKTNTEIEQHNQSSHAQISTLSGKVEHLQTKIEESLCPFCDQNTGENLMAQIASLREALDTLNVQQETFRTRVLNDMKSLASENEAERAQVENERDALKNERSAYAALLKEQQDIITRQLALLVALEEKFGLEVGPKRSISGSIGESLRFASGSRMLNQEAKPQLRDIIAELKDSKGCVIIQGFTDGQNATNVGGNIWLSFRRAETVMQAILKEIPNLKKRIQIEAKGASTALNEQPNDMLRVVKVFLETGKCS